MRIFPAAIIIVLLNLCFKSGACALTIDFAGITVTEDFNDFRGDGFSPDPLSGQLDSDEWKVTGLSSGTGTFGASHTNGDFSRGTSEGGVSTGGVYAFDVDNDSLSENYALGVQPAGRDFTDGSLILQLFNNTGFNLTSLLIEYDVFVYNDQDRTNSLSLLYSDDDLSYMDIADTDVVSPADEDVSPQWESYTFSVNLGNMEILDNDNFYLQWYGSDEGGSGSRDEFALDNLRITGYMAAAGQASAASYCQVWCLEKNQAAT